MKYILKEKFEQVVQAVALAEAFEKEGWETRVSPSRMGIPTLTVLWPKPKLSGISLAERRLWKWSEAHRKWEELP